MKSLPRSRGSFCGFSRCLFFQLPVMGHQQFFSTLPSAPAENICRLSISILSRHHFVPDPYRFPSFSYITLSILPICFLPFTMKPLLFSIPLRDARNFSSRIYCVFFVARIAAWSIPSLNASSISACFCFSASRRSSVRLSYSFLTPLADILYPLRISSNQSNSSSPNSTTTTNSPFSSGNSSFSAQQ